MQIYLKIKRVALIMQVKGVKYYIRKGTNQYSWFVKFPQGKEKFTKNIFRFNSRNL